MRRLIVGLMLFWASVAQAQVQVKDAWARPALQGQGATGAFMSLLAPNGARLLGASSPVAGVVEIHEMKMDGNVMKMRPVTVLELPAGRVVEMKPGGYHVMLMELKRPLAVGEKVRIDLRLETPDKRLITLPVDVDVATRAPGSAVDSGHHK